MTTPEPNPLLDLLAQLVQTQVSLTAALQAQTEAMADLAESNRQLADAIVLEEGTQGSAEGSLDDG